MQVIYHRARMVWCQCSLMLPLENKMNGKILRKAFIGLWGKVHLSHLHFNKKVLCQGKNVTKLNYFAVTNNSKISVALNYRICLALILHIHRGSIWSFASCYSHWGIWTKGAHVDGTAKCETMLVATAERESGGWIIWKLPARNDTYYFLYLIY